MNINERLAVKFGSIAGGMLALALPGCTTYEQGGSRTAYEQGGSRDSGAYYEPSGQVDVSYGASVQADGSYAEIRTESDFYEPLSPYGRWENVGSSGRCWIPSGVDAGWSPYSNGSWERSDAGWYWASDEPWGWATYHYGRWDSSPQFGWYWVPQTQWAPAWVSWREGGGYVGWAPLGPSGRAVVTVSLRGETQGGFVFVEERRFLDPVRPTTVTRNNAIITRTAINQGPGAAVIERASGRTMSAVPARQLRSQAEAKVSVRHAAPAATGARAVQTPVSRQSQQAAPAPVHRQAEKPAVTTARPQAPVSHQAEQAPPAPVHRQAEKPAVTAAKPQAPVSHPGEQAPDRAGRPDVKPAEAMAEPRAPAVKNEVRQTDGRGQPANLDATKRASPQAARVAESKNRTSGSAVAQTKPANKAATTRKSAEPTTTKDEDKNLR